jgi:hypothetical protein
MSLLSDTPLRFKSGKDLGEETLVEDDERVTCVDCGAIASDQEAYENGWQLVPPVCPNCLRWVATANDACCHGSPS